MIRTFIIRALYGTLTPFQQFTLRAQLREPTIDEMMNALDKSYVYDPRCIHGNMNDEQCKQCEKELDL